MVYGNFFPPLILVSKAKDLTYLVCGTYKYVYIYILYTT